MSNIVLRQNDLFLGEDWRVIYETFTNVNFKSYSFDTIKTAMIEYIRQNYPEDFNDWTENSEFIMIIDLLAYLGESLAYRVDLNARDNFIDTSERRESILRLAKMLSYNPKRNLAATGKVKIRSVKTTQIVTDSRGVNLQNRTILWNDPQNPDWFEQFLLVLNASLQQTNPFGKPFKSTVVNTTNMQLYQFNNVPRGRVAEPFSSVVSGENMEFEIINANFDTNGKFYEEHPNPDAPKHIIYMNDGTGNSSPNTGFFLIFKQGRLQFSNFNFANPIENRTTDIDLLNINDEDVWVSEINENGNLIQAWEKVPQVESIVYNSLDKSLRKVFAVQTRDQDTISIRFSDGKFGTVPKGLFRIWTRTSNGLEYTITPQEIRAKTISYRYTANSQVNKDSQYDITFTFDLFDTVANSAARETDEQIKSRAPRVYYTQNRMTNGEDYNSLPLSIGQNIIKLKSVNRVYSGQSPYFNNSDPTSRFSSTVSFGDDGLLYREFYNSERLETFPTVKTPQQIVTTHIDPLLKARNLNLFFNSVNPSASLPEYEWVFVNGLHSSSQGYFIDEFGNNVSFLPTDPSPRNIVETGAYLQIVSPTNETRWVTITNLNNGGIFDFVNAPITIDDYIPSGWKLTAVIPAFRQIFSQSENEAILQQIINNNTFGIRFDTIRQTWVIVDELNIGQEQAEFSYANQGSDQDLNEDDSWLIRAQYTPNGYRFVSRNLRYVFESLDRTRFFFNDNFSGTNPVTGRTSRSKITVLKFNEELQSGGMLDREYDFKFYENIRYSDGFIDPRRIEVIPFDNDLDGTFDFPEAFNYITNVVSENRIYFTKTVDDSGFGYFVPTTDILVTDTLTTILLYPWDVNPEAYVGAFNTSTNIFYKWDGTQVVEDNINFKFFIGRSGLNYKYSHFTSEDGRIDPAITNVIDMYVLTKPYFDSVLTWKAGNRLEPFPTPEQSAQLQQTFSDLDNFKMMQDQIIWNSSKFTKLFGETALPENQAVIKVVKVPNTKLTDNQIRQGVLNAIEEYFNLDNWAFGDVIYISELVAYIHTKMVPNVASITIVPKIRSNDGSRDPAAFSQIRQEFNALPLNVAQVDDIILISSASRENIIS